MDEEVWVFNLEERDEYRRLRSKVLNDPRGGLSPEDVTRNNSSDTLVVLVPSGGLPPMRRPNNSRPRPGNADCQVVEPSWNADINDWELLPVEGYFENILNVGPAWVEPGYAVVNRERFGNWVYECPCVETTGTSSTGTSSTGTSSTGTSSTGTSSTGTSSTGTSSTGTGTTGTGSFPYCCGFHSDCLQTNFQIVAKCDGSCLWRFTGGTPVWSLESYGCGEGECGCCAATGQQFFDLYGRAPFVGEIWRSCCCLYLLQ